MVEMKANFLPPAALLGRLLEYVDSIPTFHLIQIFSCSEWTRVDIDFNVCRGTGDADTVINSGWYLCRRLEDCCRPHRACQASRPESGMSRSSLDPL